MDSVLVIENFFDNSVLEIINEEIKNTPQDHSKYEMQGHKDLGRTLHDIDTGSLGLKVNIQQIIKDKLGIGDELHLKNMIIVEYGNKYGEPNLPPHFDGDDTEVIVNLQLSSNTTWGVGVDEEVFYIEDNTAVIFNPNEHIHWRPHKIFKDQEQVTMMFFRFSNPDNPKSYSDKIVSLDDDVYAEINEIRNNL